MSRRIGVTTADLDALGEALGDAHDGTPAQPAAPEMILLDTNVLSEAMKPAPDAAVRGWLDEQAAETLYLSSVTIAELSFGVGALPTGLHRYIAAIDPWNAVR